MEELVFATKEEEIRNFIEKLILDRKKKELKELLNPLNMPQFEALILL